MDDVDQLIKDFKTAFQACSNPDLLKLHFQFDSLSQQTPKLKRKLDFPEYNRFKSELAYLNTVCEFIEATDWYVVTEADGIKVQARGSGNEFFTKCEVTVQKDIFKTLTVLSAVDLVTTWVPVATKIEILAEPTITRKLTKFHFWFPWPCSNRQCIIEFSAFPIPREKACMILMRTPESENYLGYKIPPFAEGEIKMWVRVGCLYAQMIDENTTRIMFCVSSDMNIAFLPSNLVTYGAKHIMYYAMDELRNKIMAFEGSEYEQRIKEKPELFEYIRDSIQIAMKIDSA